MAENSNIAWCTHTHNHWIGCQKVGPGCDACYAEAWDRRFDKEHVARRWGPHAERTLTSPQNRRRPLIWQCDRRAAIDRGENPPPVNVFGGSLMDPFDTQAPAGGRDGLWALAGACPDLNWIFVTKRVGNVADMAPDGGFGNNAIVVASIVNQPEADRDMDKLVALKRAGFVHHIGVSYEPALGPVDWSPWIADVDWLIVGGESAQGGATARDFPVNWAYRAIADAYDTNCAVYIKQIGSSPRGLSPLDRAMLRHRAGADPSEWPDDLRVRQFPPFMRAA